MPPVHIELGPAPETKPAGIKPDSGTPFRIAILGDFSGRERKQDPGPVRALEIDPGNFEKVMERMGVALEIAADDVKLALQFRELRGFHPDTIYRSEMHPQSWGETMRAILHHPDFQSLESAWRSIFFLFQHVETSADLKVYLLDAPRAEIGSALRVLATDPGQWSLIAGLYTFTYSKSDCALLAKVGAIAKQLGAPFIAAMSPALLGCESIAATPDPDEWKQVSAEDLVAWNALRHSPDAAWIGLAMPRFLLRLPYGAKTSPVDSFDFEEMPAGADHQQRHDAYLWGNPAIACAALLGKAFNADGWDLRPASLNRIHGIPVHSHVPGDVTPPAEIWITERFAMTMIDAGVMPLVAVKHSDAIQLIRLQSITDPPRPLAGPWLPLADKG